VKGIVRAGQVVFLLLAAWAIGWRRLGRDDPRRMLHYGIVLCGMMLLNQRTWNHHAAVLLLAYAAAWAAIRQAHQAQRAWKAALGLLVAGWLVQLAGANGVFDLIGILVGAAKTASQRWADVADAYGPTFLHFCLLLAALIVLARALRRSPPAAAPAE
jgi:hypothetical protein